MYLYNENRRLMLHMPPNSTFMVISVWLTYPSTVGQFQFIAWHVVIGMGL